MRLIDAEALKEAMNEEALNLSNGGRIFIENINKIIDNAPTVEAVPLEHHNKIKGILDNEIKSLVDILDKERPRGEWEKCQNDMFRCSICRQADEVPTAMGIPIYNFCPNCGAKMKGGAV